MPTDPAPAAPRPQGAQVSLVDSFRRLAAWLREHDAVGLMQSLSPATKPLLLSRLEQKLGFPVPPGLRTLWLLHDGQRKATDSLVGSLHLLPVSWVLNERPATLRVLARARAEGASGTTRDELRSDAWLPIASGHGRWVLVNSASGRVFEGSEETPPLRLLARSVPEWLEQYVDAVERGEYVLVTDAEGAFSLQRQVGG